MRIGVLSDTHIPRRSKALPEKMLEDFKSVDMILHAGDLITLSVFWQLERLAPTYAVRGNTDPIEVAEELPARQIIEAGRYKIGLVHGNIGKAPTTPYRAYETFIDDKVDCIVFGHSHQSYNQVHMGILLFNPGSPTDRRFEPFCSYGILHADERLWGEIIRL